MGCLSLILLAAVMCALFICACIGAGFIINVVLFPTVSLIFCSLMGFGIFVVSFIILFLILVMDSARYDY